MAYRCPRCGKELRARPLKATDLAGGPSLGVLYILFGPFFTRYYCPEHGRIRREEFPPADRRRMLLWSLGLCLLAAVALTGLGWLLYRLIV